MVVNSSKLIRTMKILLAILLTIAFACGTAAALYLKNIRDNPSKSFGGNANFEVTDESGVTHKYNQGIISFVIVGLDSDEEREADNKGYRSDVIMVCVVDTDKNQASLVSIPRDTRTRVQVLNADGKPTRMVTTRINAAFSYGFSPDKYGYQNTLAAVNTLFNSSGVSIEPIKSYIGADMDDFVHVANLLGGVDLQLEQDVPGFGSMGEWIHLEGDKALDYVRIRKGKGLSGMDTERTGRQRGFIKAVAVKMQQMGGLATIPRLYNDCVKEGYVDTNLTLEQIYALSSSIDEIDMESVIFEMLPGYINDNEGEGYWHVNKTQLKTMVLDLFYNAQQGFGIPTAERTSELTTGSTNDLSKKTEYNYTRKSTSSTNNKKSSYTTNKKNSGNNNSGNKNPGNNSGGGSGNNSGNNNSGNNSGGSSGNNSGNNNSGNSSGGSSGNNSGSNNSDKNSGNSSSGDNSGGGSGNNSGEETGGSQNTKVNNKADNQEE